MGEQINLTIQALRLLKPLTENPKQEFAGIDMIRASGLATGTAYPIMLRLERQGLLKSRWEKGDPQKLGRPRRRYYKITRDGAAIASRALAQLSVPSGFPVQEPA